MRMPNWSRRQFIGGAASLGALSALNSGILLPTPAAAQTPRKGGRARIAFAQQSANDTLNPLRATQNLDFLRIFSLMSTLVKWDRNLDPIPDLAVEWEGTPDQATWYFRLRQGVEFHNGKTLTPEDVIYTLNLHRGATAVSMVKAYFASVTDITKDGTDRIKIQLNAPNSDFPMLLGDMHTAIVQEGFDDWDNAVGTGPFQLVDFRPGIGMLAKRFENYYNADAIYLDEVESFGIADTNARLDALRSGDVHYVTGVSSRSTDALGADTGTELVVSKTRRRLCVNMPANMKPFENLDLRTAIKYAIDREAMVKNVLNGHGRVANDLFLRPGDKYYNESLPQRAYDPDKAAFHYKKSGYSGPLELFSSDVNYGAPATDYAIHMKSTAAKAGIDIQVTRLPVEGYYAAVSLKKPFYIDNWFALPTFGTDLAVLSLSNSPRQESGYTNPEVDALALEARGVPDGPRRAELYGKIQKILWENDGLSIPVFIDTLDGRSTKLQGVVPHPFAEAAGWRLCEEVWLS